VLLVTACTHIDPTCEPHPVYAVCNGGWIRWVHMVLGVLSMERVKVVQRQAVQCVMTVQGCRGRRHV
jgi:hypothetical protein